MAQELKEVEYPNCFGSYYRKDEVDAVLAEKDKTIADAVQIIKEQEHEIAEKDKEIAELKEERRWRKCSEELPKYYEYVFAFCPNYGSVEKAGLFEDGVWRDSDWNFLEVTRWMPLPKAPEEAK